MTLNEQCLPEEATPKLIPSRQVTGVHGAHLIIQQFLLKNITLPEFSPTKKIAKPIQALLFTNADTAYDLILGMDKCSFSASQYAALQKQ